MTSAECRETEFDDVMLVEFIIHCVVIQSASLQMKEVLKFLVNMTGLS